MSMALLKLSVEANINTMAMEKAIALEVVAGFETESLGEEEEEIKSCDERVFLGAGHS
jgi:hypothetical protein